MAAGAAGLTPTTLPRTTPRASTEPWPRTCASPAGANGGGGGGTAPLRGFVAEGAASAGRRAGGTTTSPLCERGRCEAVDDALSAVVAAAGGAAGAWLPWRPDARRPGSAGGDGLDAGRELRSRLRPRAAADGTQVAVALLRRPRCQVLASSANPRLCHRKLDHQGSGLLPESVTC